MRRLLVEGPGTVSWDEVDTPTMKMVLTCEPDLDS